MNKSLEKYLVEKYPLILADYGGDPKKTCMAWGLAVGNGWFFLLDSLFASIQRHIDQHNEWVENYGKVVYEEQRAKGEIPDEKLVALIPQLKARQIKEKFAGLRFYYEGGDEKTRGMISLAENLSYHICEDCGVMSELVNMNKSGWLRSICPCCVRPEYKQEHLDNRDTKLAELWGEVREEELREIKELLKKPKED